MNNLDPDFDPIATSTPADPGPFGFAEVVGPQPNSATSPMTPQTSDQTDAILTDPEVPEGALDELEQELETERDAMATARLLTQVVDFLCIRSPQSTAEGIAADLRVVNPGLADRVEGYFVDLVATIRQAMARSLPHVTKQKLDVIAAACRQVPDPVLVDLGAAIRSSSSELWDRLVRDDEFAPHRLTAMRS